MRKCICSLLFLLVTVVAANAATTIKIATIAPEGSSWMRQMRSAAGQVKAQTDGRVRLKFYGGGVMGNEKSVLRKIRVGQLHGAALTGSGLSAISPGAVVYSLPLLTASVEQMNCLRQKMDKEIAARLLKRGFVSFGFASGGYANLMSKMPIHNAAEMKGLKVWVPEGDRVGYAVLEALGLAPVTLPLSDVLTGLQTGLVDIVGTSPLGALAFQWYTQLHYITRLPLVYVYGALVIDKRVMARLSHADGKVVRAVLEQMYRNFDQQNLVDDEQALAVLQHEGLQMVEPTSGEYARWNTVAQQVIKRMVTDGVLDGALYQRVQARLHACRSVVGQ